MSVERVLWAISTSSAIGARKKQEDFLDCFELPGPNREGRRLLGVMADGMGGHAAGEVASRAAVRAFRSAALSHKRESSEDILAVGMAASSGAVVREAESRISRRGMGTTLTAIMLQHEGEQLAMRWISVGDSPLWRISGAGRIARLNADHSLAGQLEAELAAGRVSREQAACDPRRNQSNVLIHVLSGEPLDMGVADFRREPLPLEVGDTIVLATDGVETLSEAAIADYVARTAEKRRRPSAEGLCDAVLRCGFEYQDNVSIVMIGIAVRGPFWRFWRG